MSKMDSNTEKLAIVAYVPVISRAYLDFYDDNQNINDLFVTDTDINQEIRPLRKDLRALEPRTVAELLRARTHRTVKTIGRSALKGYLADKTHLVMPDDEVSEHIISSFDIPEDRYSLRPLFLRWNRENLSKEHLITPDGVVDISSIDPIILRELGSEVVESNDWWIQVGAIVADDNDTIIERGHNYYLPNQASAEIDGDIRSNLRKGDGADFYNTIHAEAEAVASAAKTGHQLMDSSMYVSTFPCQSCAKLIARSGISKLYYFKGYAISDGLDVMKSEGVEIINIEGDITIQDKKHKSVKYPTD